MPLLPTVVDFDITSYTSLPGWGSLGGEPYERVSHCSSGGTDESGVNGSRGTWRRNIRRVGPFPLLAEATAVVAFWAASTPSTRTFSDGGQPESLGSF